MKTDVHTQRRAERAMKRVATHGTDPRDTSPHYAKVYRRMWVDDCRRRPWTIENDAYAEAIDRAERDDSLVRCRGCDQGKVKRFHCPICNDLDRK